MNPETTRTISSARWGAIVVTLLCATVLLVPGSPAQEKPRPATGSATERPNILLVVSDDQPLRAMETMPLTRRWMRRFGVKYTNAYATTPQCCPSRATLLTGQYAHNHRVTTNDRGSVEQLDHETTVQRVLSDNGYLTAAYGKFFNSWDLETPPPNFDEWAITPSSARA